MLLAKSFKQDGEYVTLSEHVKDILCAFESLKNKLDHKILSEICLPIKIAILYHDFGKVIPRFQIDTLGNKGYKPFDIIYEIPHSIFSIFWIDEEKVKEKISDKKIFDFIISAVAYHHWRENFENIIHNRDEKLKKFIDKVLNEWKDELEANLKNEFQNFSDPELQELVIDIKLNEKRLMEVKNGTAIYQYAIPPYRFDYYPLRETLTKSFEDLKKWILEDLKKWILIAGFLQKCDHFASFCEEEGESLNKIEINQLDFNSVKGKVKEIIKEEDESKIWQIQKIQNNLDKNIILIAPTGYGKTEFAFLWGSGSKFFYTLPLRSAVNQIFERARKIFDEERTGILHSDADVYLLEKTEDIGDTIKLYDLAKALSHSSIISTGDQFFPYALRPPGFEKIFATFSYSKLIVDEVQAYDPKACAIIVSFIEWIYKMGGKFLLMTATLPEFVKKEIERRIGNNEFQLINIYEENKEDFQKIFKHKVKIQIINNEKDKFDIPDDKLNEVITQAKNGKRVLVILNTVKQAQSVYERLFILLEEMKNKMLENEIEREKLERLKNKIFLLHSRFTIEDRSKKEFILTGGEFEIKNGKIKIFGQEVDISQRFENDDFKFGIVSNGKYKLTIIFKDKKDEKKVYQEFELDGEKENKDGTEKIKFYGWFSNPKLPDEKEGKILVATQVVEASLDIDADILFTEICPLDSLVQRMGRVLRRYFYRDGKVINKSTNQEIELNNDFKAYDKENNGKPNVYIWIFKEGIESGKGKVYDKELLKFSIAWLLKKQKEGNITEIQDDLANQELEKIKAKINEVFGFIKEQMRQNQGGTRRQGRSQSQSDDLYKLILEKDDFIEQLNDNEIELSEYDKYLLVSNFYKLLPKDGSYLEEFYSTLEVLDSGYMSDKKAEAQEIFREIYDVNVIPENRIKDLIDAIEGFIKKNKSQSGKGLFTKFKDEVLSKFVVPVSFWLVKKDFGEHKKVFYKVMYEIKWEDIGISKEEEEEEKRRWERRLKTWLSDIYFEKINYDSEKGFLEPENKERESWSGII